MSYPMKLVHFFLTQEMYVYSFCFVCGLCCHDCCGHISNHGRPTDRDARDSEEVCAQTPILGPLSPLCC